MEQLITYIQKYVSLSPSDIQLIEEAVITRNYLKGQYVVQQGDICRYESFIIFLAQPKPFLWMPMETNMW